jgi:lipopolysaccharide transport system permease protein
MLLSPTAMAAEYRDHATLLRYLAWRDLRLRFQNYALGALWVALQPLLPAAIFAVVFARILQPATSGVPYSLFALAGFVPWTFFSTAVSTASMAFVWNANLLNKVYFPRAVLPASAILGNSVDLGAGMLLLLGWTIFKGYPPRWEWLLLPLLCVYLASIAFVASLGLATANALNRNVKFAIPFLMQVWIYATPVVYPASLLPARARWLMGLNPLTGPLDCFRAVLFRMPIDPRLLLLSLCSAVLCSAASLLLFRHYEAVLAERL